MIRKLIYMILSLLFISATPVEKKITDKDASEIFKKMADWFKDSEKYSMQTEFKTFKSHESNTPFETQTGFIKKSGHSFHCFLMGIHTIQDGKYQVTIDSSQKIISVKDAEETIWENISAFVIQKGISTSQSIALVEAGDEFKIQLIPSKSSSINYYEIQYDKAFRIKNVLLKLTKMDMRDDGITQYEIYPKLTMRFYSYTNGTSLGKNDFDLSGYVSFNERKISLSKKYVDYQLLDLRVKDKIKK